MTLGIIGLGKMGVAIAHRVLKESNKVVGYDTQLEQMQEAQVIGVQTVDRPEEIPAQVDAVWIMVPAGNTVDVVLEQLKPVLKPGMILVDGGNSKFTDSIRRAEALAQKDIFFLDCGTSGGVHGKEDGFCLMVGGQVSAFSTMEPIFRAIAAPDGYAYLGPSGTGHYVKMIHNGIEYALLQAYAEGFHLLKDGAFKDLSLERIADLWNHGSIIRSWILHLLHDVLKRDTDFKKISGFVAESGMAKWTVEQAEKAHVPVPLIKESLAMRYWSQKTGGNFATKLVALLRHEFGGHPIKKASDE